MMRKSFWSLILAGLYWMAGGESLHAQNVWLIATASYEDADDSTANFDPVPTDSSVYLSMGDTVISFEYDTIAQQWVPRLMRVFGAIPVKTSGRAQSYVLFWHRWNSMTSSWEMDSRSSYFYQFPNGNDTILTETWDGASWNPAILEVFYVNNGRVDSFYRWIWDTIANGWTPYILEYYTYDGMGNIVEMVTITMDNPVRYDTTVYAWDAQGRLQSMTQIGGFLPVTLEVRRYRSGSTPYTFGPNWRQISAGYDWTYRDSFMMLPLYFGDSVEIMAGAILNGSYFRVRTLQEGQGGIRVEELAVHLRAPFFGVDAFSPTYMYFSVPATGVMEEAVQPFSIRWIKTGDALLVQSEVPLKWVRLISLSGTQVQMVYQVHGKDARSGIQLPVQFLSAGAYLLEAYSQDGQRVALKILLE